MQTIFLDERAVAERYGLSPRVIQGWRRKGTGPRFRKLGKSVRYELGDLEAWEAAAARTSTSDTGPGA